MDWEETRINAETPFKGLFCSTCDNTVTEAELDLVCI